MLKLIPGICAAVVLSVAAPAAALAQSSEMERLISIMRAKGMLTEEEANEIREAVAEEDEIERAPMVGHDLDFPPTAPVTDQRPVISAFPFAVESGDGRHVFRTRGRIQVDAAAASWGDDIGLIAREADNPPEFGTTLRRLRMGMLGVVDQRWEWQLEADFAGNEVDLANAYVAYLAQHGGRLAFGYFKEPFTMEYSTSSRFISFIERSAAADAYKTNRETGILYETIRPNWYAGVGAFSEGVSSSSRDVRQGYSIGTRVTAAPYLSGSDFVHIGGGLNHRWNGEDKGTNLYEPVRLRTRAGTRAIDVRLIGRDDLVAVEDYTRYNLELAAGRGSWWFAGEYIRVDLNLDRAQLQELLGNNATTRGSLTQDGFYLQGGVFLTGESKTYRPVSGDFGRIRPSNNFNPSAGQWGAIELLARYSQADSLEHTRVGRGQKLDHYTLGLNWYFTPHVLMRANVMYMEAERDGVGDDDAWVYAMRMQFDW